MVSLYSAAENCVNWMFIKKELIKKCCFEINGCFKNENIKINNRSKEMGEKWRIKNVWT